MWGRAIGHGFGVAVLLAGFAGARIVPWSAGYSAKQTVPRPRETLAGSGRRHRRAVYLGSHVVDEQQVDRHRRVLGSRRWETRRMDVVVFHSMWGLRAVEVAAAERLRSWGYRVSLPDLFDGRTSPGEIEAGFALLEEIGWSTITGRAYDALAGVSDDAVMIGFSMGVGVIDQVWPDRLGAAAVACLHAAASVPSGVRRGTPVQLHFGAGDRFAPAERVEEFRRSAEAAGAVALIREYDGAGHYFTDESHPDYSPAAAAGAWNDLQGMLESLQ